MCKEKWVVVRFKLSDSQWGIVKMAIERMKNVWIQEGWEDPKNADGIALEFICAEFLNDPNYEEG